MKIITERYQIKHILETWKKIHYLNGKWSQIFWDNAPYDSTELIYEQLKQLDLDTATAEDIAKIVGHDGMTTIECDECNRPTSRYVILGEVDNDNADVGCDFEKTTLCLCQQCFHKGLKLFNGKH